MKLLARERYYVCGTAQKRGYRNCPSKSIPAEPIEGFVVERVRAVGRDPELLRQVLEQAREKGAARIAELEAEHQGLDKELRAWNGEVSRLAGQLNPGDVNGPLVTRLADLHARIGAAEHRAAKVRERLTAVTEGLISEEDAAKALAAFDPVWAILTPLERARVIALLVARVEYDGSTGAVTVSFHPTGLTALADELARHHDHRSIA